jgi:hypothetical protein
MKKILNYKLFLEKLGIPEGNLELAEEVFDYIITNFNQIKLDGEANTIKGPFKIKDFNIENIYLNINLIKREEIDKFVIVSAGLESPSRSEGIYQIFNKSDYLSIELNIATPTNIDINDLKDFLISERSVLVGIFSHELKHGYDHYILGKSLSKEMGDYRVFSGIRFGHPTIDTFLYLVYFSSNIETSVYASEMGSLLRTNNVSGEEFKDFLTKTRIYDLLDGLSNFNYNDMFDNILQDINIIREQLEEQKPENEILPTDNKDLANYFLDLIVDNITKNRIESLRAFLPKKIVGGFLSRLLGIGPELMDGMEDYLNKVSKGITFKNNRDFFEYWIKRFKFVSDKMKKKLAKLYDMCPNKKTSIHQKINQRSIVNPELYDKLVQKTPLYFKK